MPKSNSKKSFLGLVSQRTRWGLTWWGRLAAILIILLFGVIVVYRIHPFLAISKPVDARVMVVEGWISMPSLRAAAEAFRVSDYEMLYTVGESMPSSVGGGEQNFAEITANQFLELGIPSDQVKAIAAGEAQRDRTYTSAVALRESFESEGVSVSSFNVITKGPHGRRSRLMFEAAFSDEVSVGVISISDMEYDSLHWWRYSEGVKEVISEAAAYLYARFLFHADD